MSIISILGSSNSKGNTRELLDACLSACRGDLIDLNEVALSPWDYKGRNADDGFAGVAQRIADSADIIFATPVYWYAMSSQMKTFFDRTSDLITRRKALGRALAGKRTWLLATGSDDEMPEGFEVPFARTSDYFGMRYCGALYQKVHNDRLLPESLQLAAVFGQQIIGEVEQCAAGQPSLAALSAMSSVTTTPTLVSTLAPASGAASA